MSGRQTVLVVEDDPFIREIMHEVLEDEGFRAVSVDSTQDAIKTLEHDNDNIAAIFADIDLGDHGGGYEVARLARQMKPDVKVIYTSGGAREDFVKERVDDAVFVQKPYSPTDVCMLLKRKLAD